jgi:hypothetical protein
MALALGDKAIQKDLHPAQHAPGTAVVIIPRCDNDREVGMHRHSKPPAQDLVLSESQAAWMILVGQPAQPDLKTERRLKPSGISLGNFIRDVCILVTNLISN